MNFLDIILKAPSRSIEYPGNDWDPESGYSSVIGVLLLIAIVMVMGGILSFVLISSPLPEKVPMTYLGISQSDEGIEVFNKAGDTLTSDSVSIVVDGVDRTNEFRMQDNSQGWDTLEVGEHLSYKSFLKTESIRIIYHGNSGQYLMAASESEIITPQVITPTPTPEVTPVPVTGTGYNPNLSRFRVQQHPG